MYITRLVVNDVRNLEQVSLDELGAMNFFIGPNGAGKTSILEAISLASQGRSFRNHKIQSVIHQERAALQVFLECTDAGGNTHRLGIERNRQNLYNIRINGAAASTLAQLSAILPVVILDATAFDLLDGSASIRRKFLDWGVFHVEHGFYNDWKSCNRAIEQRNALLKMQVSDYSQYEAWDEQFVEYAIKIENYRLHYLQSFARHLEDTLALLGLSAPHKLYYKNGWGIERAIIDESMGSTSDLHTAALRQLLKENFARDLRYGTTHVGPHKADIVLKSGQNDLKDIYSRGQKKLLITALKMVQALTVKQSDISKTPIILLDDLPAELDAEHLAKILQYISDGGYQCFITAVDRHFYSDNRHLKPHLFTVEHGKIEPIKDVSRGTHIDVNTVINQ